MRSFLQITNERSCRLPEKFAELRHKWVRQAYPSLRTFAAPRLCAQDQAHNLSGPHSPSCKWVGGLSQSMLRAQAVPGAEEVPCEWEP